MKAPKIVTIAALVIGLPLLALEACSQQTNTQMTDLAPTTNSRVSVTRIGVFKDELAYDERRGIYVIVDSKTGKEYIGVSGIGITETGEHDTGKEVYEDER